jgi:hypothetical protein
MAAQADSLFQSDSLMSQALHTPAVRTNRQHGWRMWRVGLATLADLDELNVNEAQREGGKRGGEAGPDLALVQRTLAAWDSKHVVLHLSTPG